LASKVLLVVEVEIGACVVASCRCNEEIVEWTADCAGIVKASRAKSAS
jgi:hypothetical protein